MVVGSPDKPGTCRKRFTETGLWFGEVTIDSGKGGEPVELVRQMQTGVPDKTPREERRATVAAHRHNDIYYHSAFCTEILCEDGTRIPKYVLEGNVYDGQAGHVMRITVL